VADEHESRETADDSEVDQPAQGAPQNADREVRLHSELGHEARQVVMHPAEEAHRLREELKAGEADTTPLIAVTGLAIWIAIIVAIVLVLVVLAIYLV
jgi:hypothetical protein